MKWLTFKIEKKPGFRFNLIDVGFILILFSLTYVLFKIDPHTSLLYIPLYLGMSFFLFCNVFRIGDRLERIWYIPFTFSAGYCVCTMNLELFWLLVISLIEPLKWVLIIYRIKRGPYVGIMYQKFKPTQHTNSQNKV